MRKGSDGIRRWVVAALSVLALAAGTGRATAEIVAAVSVNSGSLPIYVAEAKGYFAAEGVAVRFQPCALGKICLRMVLDGEAALGTVADLPIALAAYGSDRFAVVATINTNRNDTKVVTRRGSGIRVAADLVGRRVGTHLGTTAQYALEALLLLEGVDPAKLDLVSLQPGEGRTRLLAKSIDAVAVFEPYAFEAVQALGADAVVLHTRGIYTQTWNLVVPVGPGAPAAAELQAFLRALDRACALIQREPAYAKSLLQQRVLRSAELVESSWPALAYQLSLDQSLLTTLEGQARWAERIDLIQGPRPNYLQRVQSQPLRKVRPDQVTLAE